MVKACPLQGLMNERNDIFDRYNWRLSQRLSKQGYDLPKNGFYYSKRMNEIKRYNMLEMSLNLQRTWGYPIYLFNIVLVHLPRATHSVTWLTINQSLPRIDRVIQSESVLDTGLGDTNITDLLPLLLILENRINKLLVTNCLLSLLSYYSLLRIALFERGLE